MLLDLKELEELRAKELGQGVLTGKESFCMSDDTLVTTKVTKVCSKFPSYYHFLFYERDLETDKRDETPLWEEKNVRKHYLITKFGVGRDKYKRTICVTRANHEDFTTKCTYYYSFDPVFEGQTPSETAKTVMEGMTEEEEKKLQEMKDEGKLPQHEEENPEDDNDNFHLLKDDTPLYVVARAEHRKDAEGWPCRSLLSVVTGCNPDHVTGFAWKDLYKGIRFPGFSYNAIVMDLQGNIVCKSEEQGSLDNRPIFMVGSGAHVGWVIATLEAFIPDGSRTAAKTAEVAGMVMQGLSMVFGGH